jgi:hypothetical protein
MKPAGGINPHARFRFNRPNLDRKAEPPPPPSDDSSPVSRRRLHPVDLQSPGLVGTILPAHLLPSVCPPSQRLILNSTSPRSISQAAASDAVVGNRRRQAPATEGEGSRGVPHGDERAWPWRRSGSAQWPAAVRHRRTLTTTPLMFKPSIDIQGINLKIIDYKNFFVLK